MSLKLDQTDRKILEIIQQRGKISNAQLSKEINLSAAPTLERVKKLEKLGYIESYHAKLSLRKLGLMVTTFVHVKLVRHNKENNNIFMEMINQLPEVVECHQVTGQSHFLLRVITTDMDSYQQLIMDNISEIPVVDEIQSLMVLKTMKETNTVPIL
jgi:DNA-binding Lrp family transcriptional regulator